jgi:4-aminobutyrate aminotransferase
LTQATIQYIEEVVFQNILPPDNCAGILLEPIQGEGGYIVPPDDFFPELRKLCDRHGSLLIVDEVQSGVGRTGQWWAVENWNTEPDIVCFAKGIASGVPLGGIMTRDKVMNWPTGAHGNTYGGNPIACSAGLATLKLIEDEYLQNAAVVGEYAIDALSEIQARHPTIGDVRGQGLMIGVEFVQDKETKLHAHDLREEIIDLAFQGGLLTLGSGVSSIRIAPPLSIRKDQIDEGLAILEQAITTAEKGR